MLSESTARLVEAAAVMGEPEMVHIKGADELVSARRLHSIGAHRGGVGRRVSTLVGRGWETSYRNYRDRHRAMADIARFRGAYGDG